jgi:hypothetical protein
VRAGRHLREDVRRLLRRHLRGNLPGIVLPASLLGPSLRGVIAAVARLRTTTSDDGREARPGGPGRAFALRRVAESRIEKSKILTNLMHPSFMHVIISPPVAPPPEGWHHE